MASDLLGTTTASSGTSMTAPCAGSAAAVPSTPCALPVLDPGDARHSILAMRGLSGQSSGHKTELPDKPSNLLLADKSDAGLEPLQVSTRRGTRAKSHQAYDHGQRKDGTANGVGRQATRDGQDNGALGEGSKEAASELGLIGGKRVLPFRPGDMMPSLPSTSAHSGVVPGEYMIHDAGIRESMQCTMDARIDHIRTALLKYPRPNRTDTDLVPAAPTRKIHHQTAPGINGLRETDQIKNARATPAAQLPHYMNATPGNENQETEPTAVNRLDKNTETMDPSQHARGGKHKPGEVDPETSWRRHGESSTRSASDDAVDKENSEQQGVPTASNKRDAISREATEDPAVPEPTAKKRRRHRVNTGLVYYQRVGYNPLNDPNSIEYHHALTSMKSRAERERQQPFRFPHAPDPFMGFAGVMLPAELEIQPVQTQTLAQGLITARLSLARERAGGYAPAPRTGAAAVLPRTIVGGQSFERAPNGMLVVPQPYWDALSRRTPGATAVNSAMGANASFHAGRMPPGLENQTSKGSTSTEQGKAVDGQEGVAAEAQNKHNTVGSGGSGNAVQQAKPAMQNREKHSRQLSTAPVEHGLTPSTNPIGDAVESATTPNANTANHPTPTGVAQTPPGRSQVSPPLQPSPSPNTPAPTALPQASTAPRPIWPFRAAQLSSSLYDLATGMPHTYPSFAAVPRTDSIGGNNGGSTSRATPALNCYTMPNQEVINPWPPVAAPHGYTTGMQNGPRNGQALSANGVNGAGMAAVNGYTMQNGRGAGYGPTLPVNGVNGANGARTAAVNGHTLQNGHTVQNGHTLQNGRSAGYGQTLPANGANGMNRLNGVNGAGAGAEAAAVPPSDGAVAPVDWDAFDMDSASSSLKRFG